MRLLAFLLLAVGVSACSEIRGPIYKTEPGPSSDSSFLSLSLQRHLPAYGQVPLPQVLRALVDLQVVKRWPAGDLVTDPLPVQQITRTGDAIRMIEESQRWVYDPDTRVFSRAVATHSIDSPDAFGSPAAGPRASLEPRSIVQISFRFARVEAGISTDDISAGATLTSFRAGVPEGVRSTWSSTTERSYFEGVQSTQSYTNAVVNTQLRTVDAGLQLDAMAARLPGGFARLDGQLSISSFLGASGLDTATVKVPLQLDGTRHEWHRVCVIRGGDASAQLAFKGWRGSLDLTGDALEVLVRID